MELYGSHLIAIGLDGDRLNDIIDKLVDNEVSKRFDQNLPQPPGSVLVTIPALSLLNLLPTDEYEAMAQSQYAASNQAEKERMYYEIARFAPQLSYQQRTQIAGVLMAGYDALLAQNTQTSFADIPMLHADAIELTRPQLMQEFSLEEMQSIDYFLESRRLEKLQRMASSRGLIR
jgi:hypothetical protein